MPGTTASKAAAQPSKQVAALSHPDAKVAQQKTKTPRVAPAPIVVPPAAQPAPEEKGEISLFDELLKTLEPESPHEAATEIKRSLARAESDARAATRRQRYQREAERRVRKRIIAALITGGAILIGVGVGAAFALTTTNAVTNPRPAGADEPTIERTRSPEVRQPVIVSFTTASSPVPCASDDAVATAEFTWDVADAKNVQLAPTSTKIDPATLPQTRPLKAAKIGVPFSCAAASQSYTLTAVGEDGTVVSKALTVTRKLDPAAPPRDATRQPSNGEQDQAPAPQPSSPLSEPSEPSSPPIEPSTPPTEPSIPPIEPSTPPSEPSIPPTEPSIPPIDPEPTPPPLGESGVETPPAT